VGLSLGGLVIANYLAGFPDCGKCILDSAVVYCAPVDLYAANKHVIKEEKFLGSRINLGLKV